VIEKEQTENLRQLRAERNSDQVTACLADLRTAASGKTNIMPALVACAHAYCTIGEIAKVLREVFGEYHDPGIF